MQRSITEMKTEHWALGEKTAHVARVESAMLLGARKYFEKEGYYEICVPHITRATGACENVDTLFEVDYFGQRGYLSQTGQLYLESLIPKLGKLYTIGPSFRAEPDIDGRHLTEFTLVEIELEIDFDNLLREIENVVSSMFESALEHASESIDALGGDIQTVERSINNFQRISYDDAVQLLEKPFGVKWGDDLKSVHEQYIVKQHDNLPTFITHFPKAIKFFNMKENEKRPELVNSADLIVPLGGECVGAAEREYTYENVYRRLMESPMLARLESKGGSINDFDWYLNHLKKHGNVPHGGCGIGMSRVMQFVIGSNDIRESTTFPMNRITLI
ncbi:MAG: amino acid--tRNA ligase-related protein [Candidatus Micrarchaeia archaeon]